MIRRWKRMAASLALATGVISGGFFIGVTAASASPSGNYGAGATYQVEISANSHEGAFWVWAALYSSSPNANTGTIDYQEADCIHMGGGHATDAAAHDAGDGTWKIVDNTLYLIGVNIIDNALTATFAVPLPSSGSHSSGLTITITQVNIPSPPPTFPPKGAQFFYPTGPESQNQIAGWNL